MSLFEQLQSDLKTAMRDKNVVARQTLRSAIAAVKNKRIEKGEDLEEPEVLAVLTKCVKSREDSATQYADAGREDLESNERAEIEVLKDYLPAQLSEDETKTLVEKTIDELGLESKKELGKLMKSLMASHKGQIDGKLVQRFAGELLS